MLGGWVYHRKWSDKLNDEVWRNQGSLSHSVDPSIQDLFIVYDKRAELWYTICPVVEQVKLFTNYSGGYLILRSGKQQTTTKEKNGVKEAHLWTSKPRLESGYQILCGDWSHCKKNTPDFILCDRWYVRITFWWSRDLRCRFCRRWCLLFEAWCFRILYSKELLLTYLENLSILMHKNEVFILFLTHLK